MRRGDEEDDGASGIWREQRVTPENSDALLKGLKGKGLKSSAETDLHMASEIMISAVQPPGLNPVRVMAASSRITSHQPPSD
ncbi:MAG: hypothetical protein Q9211_004161 [Gyalolechia sp. 1 TL-2023]